MDSITISVMVDEGRRLVIDLPPDVPVGPADVTIKPLGSQTTDIENPAREAVRAKLLAAGRLALDHGIPDDIEPVSEEELEELGRLAPGARSSEELIDEDRGTY
jgi:hypothetical protein